MRFSTLLMPAALAAMLLLFGSIGRCQEDSGVLVLKATEDEEPIDMPADFEKGDWPLIGTWHALSTSIPEKGGESTTFADENGAVSLVISEKTCTLRIGTKVLAEMSYTADPTPKPCTIDLKTKDGEMLGVYKVGKERLALCFKDKAKGRPKSFVERKDGMVFVFRRVHPVSLCTIDTDGSNLRQVLTMPEFTFIGSPEMSPDGQKIAFDTWRATMGEQCGDARIFVVNADGSEVKDLGLGAMPSWSPDGKRLTCSQYGKREGCQRGVWIMNADGSEPQLIDGDGWASQWAPKSNKIAYTLYKNGGAELVVYDMDKNLRRTLPLGKTYEQITWGFTWSPDEKWLCFQGDKGQSGQVALGVTFSVNEKSLEFKGDVDVGGTEIAAVSTEEGKKDLKVVLSSKTHPEIDNADATIGWCDGDQIVISTKGKNDGQGRLYFYDFTGGAAPKLVPGIPDDWYSFGPAASADGKKIVFAAVPPMQPAEAK